MPQYIFFGFLFYVFFFSFFYKFVLWVNEWFENMKNDGNFKQFSLTLSVSYMFSLHSNVWKCFSFSFSWIMSSSFPFCLLLCSQTLFNIMALYSVFSTHYSTGNGKRWANKRHICVAFFELQKFAMWIIYKSEYPTQIFLSPKVDDSI